MEILQDITGTSEIDHKISTRTKPYPHIHHSVEHYNVTETVTGPGGSNITIINRLYNNNIQIPVSLLLMQL